MHGSESIERMVKQMENQLIVRYEEIEREVTRIINLRVANLVCDVDLLVVALCAGNLNEIAATLHFANAGDICHTAAHKALDLGWNCDLRDSVVKKGYFANGLCGLVEISKQNPDAGSRLMPIMCEMISDCKKYGISKKLKRETQRYLESVRQRDGFAILGIYDDECEVVVRAADGVFGDDRVTFHFRWKPKE